MVRPGNLGRQRSVAGSHHPCVTASSPTAPVTSGVGLRPSLRRVSPLPSPQPLSATGVGAEHLGRRSLSALQLPLTLASVSRSACPCPPTPAWLIQAWPDPWGIPAWLVPGPGVSSRLGVREPPGQHRASTRLSPVHPSPWSLPSRKTLWTPSCNPSPCSRRVGGLVLRPGPHLKLLSSSVQTSTPSWAPSSSRRWYESSWAKG